MPRYPGQDAAEAERRSKPEPVDDGPDFIAGAPNYDKFEGWTPERVLAWLNID